MELEKLLRRYGATAFSVSSDYDAGTITVAFRIPDTPGQPANIPVRLAANVQQVAEALYGPLRKGQSWSNSGREQAERVAWRHLVLWVDAALCAAGAGLQSISEAFFAHVVVKAEDGTHRRVIEHLGFLAGNGNDWKALLPPPKP